LVGEADSLCAAASRRAVFTSAHVTIDDLLGITSKNKEGVELTGQCPALVESRPRAARAKCKFRKLEFVTDHFMSLLIPAHSVAIFHDSVIFFNQ